MSRGGRSRKETYTESSQVPYSAGGTKYGGSRSCVQGRVRLTDLRDLSRVKVLQG